MLEPIDGPDGQPMDPIRVPEADLESIEASVRKLLDQSAEQARQLDSLAAAPDPMPFAGFSMPGMPGMPAPVLPPDPKPILELDGEERENELDSLTDWVEDFLMPVYGAEITTAAPWCEQWQEHLDIVAWLHALWMAYQQHKDPEAYLSGMFVWHRTSSPTRWRPSARASGPLSACQTDPDRPAHRLLRGPGRSTRPAATAADEAGHAFEAAS